MSDNRNPLTGASVVCQILQRFGVKTVFALAGASQTHLLDECDKAKMRIVPTRHESATVGAADGYSRVTGKIGVAMVNVDQGMPNAVTGVLTAFEACSPVLLLVGREPDDWTEPELDNDHDALPLLRPITKWARTVHSPSRLGEYVEAACRRALSGRPGPVVIAFPKNFLSDPVTPGVELNSPATPPPKPEPAKKDIVAAADLLANAEKPMIIAGSGAFRAGAGTQLRNLAERFRIPVLAHELARGMVPEDHLIGWNWALAQTAAKHADVVVWAGVRMAKKFGYGLAPRFSKTVKMIQIDIYPEEIGRSRPVDVGICADAAKGLQSLLTTLDNKKVKAFSGSWIKESLKDRLAAIEATGREESSIHPYRLARAIMSRIPKDAIFVNDGASILVQTWAAMGITVEGGYMDTMPLGSMGMGTPLALGAAAGAKEMATKTGNPERPVVMLTGDGAFGFYPSELGSAAQAGFSLVCVIANNGGWGNEFHSQPRQIGRTINADFGRVCYDYIAKGYGCAGERVDDPSELGPAIDRAIAIKGKPAVVDVIVHDSGFTSEQSTLMYYDVEKTRGKHFADEHSSD